ncbi:MAG TPA: hypothetical protein PKI49_06495 [Pseudomonadota bacterium]|nr:hypothetical protein [Pseudomonadota bacterium]HNI61461.1 hypothetical protein [Pseudomonadota bacterium]HNK46331.1 hypothetical protein [Pseudomonadota bacterium]HNN52550.1 hypothetical protein [Pseudomonadota bacterium]HNO68141.1 hypothetical protein [Pseudomonadota bacterium]
MAEDDTRRNYDIKSRVLGSVLRFCGVLAVGCLTSACAVTIPQDGLCAPMANPTVDCQDGRGLGAVVVRWRMADLQLGRLLGRGLCCCNPSPSRDGIDRAQCDQIGSSCLDSPAWLVEHVNLTLHRSDDDTEYSWDIPCSEGEFTTPYCIRPGLYDMKLTADINKLADDGSSRFLCAQKKAVSPPAVRRAIVEGQATNLDAVVLGINAP